MLNKGLKLFTTSPTHAEIVAFETKKGWGVLCCECCTAPYLGILCKSICKYRKATYKEFIENITERMLTGNEQRAKTSSC